MEKLEQTPMSDKEDKILAEQNAFHLVKALDLIDECYHFLKSHPPSKETMSYNKWESLVEETDYMREFNAQAEHERCNKIEIETVEDGGGCYVAGVQTLTLEQFEHRLKEQRNEAIDECIAIFKDEFSVTGEDVDSEDWILTKRLEKLKQKQP